jgi:arabinan endo-1,5-alpha-L-arabinosidase
MSRLAAAAGRHGIPLLTSRVGGTPVIQQNGNTWIGTGHNAVVTDAAGQDWLAYHAIDRADPYLDEPYGINKRPMLLDRLDWIDGWPVVRAGAGASAGSQRAPVSAGVVDDRFERAGLGSGWRVPAPGWQVVPAADPDSGGLLRHTAAGPGVLESTRPGSCGPGRPGPPRSPPARRAAPPRARRSGSPSAPRSG